MDGGASPAAAAESWPARPSTPRGRPEARAASQPEPPALPIVPQTWCWRARADSPPCCGVRRVRWRSQAVCGCGQGQGTKAGPQATTTTTTPIDCLRWRRQHRHRLFTVMMMMPLRRDHDSGPVPWARATHIHPRPACETWEQYERAAASRRGYASPRALSSRRRLFFFLAKRPGAVSAARAASHDSIHDLSLDAVSRAFLQAFDGAGELAEGDE